MNLKACVKLTAIQFQAALLVLFLALRMTGILDWHYWMTVTPQTSAPPNLNGLNQEAEA